jgi:hypothetical protein
MHTRMHLAQSQNSQRVAIPTSIINQLVDPQATQAKHQSGKSQSQHNQCRSTLAPNHCQHRNVFRQPPGYLLHTRLGIRFAILTCALAFGRPLGFPSFALSEKPPPPVHGVRVQSLYTESVHRACIQALIQALYTGFVYRLCIRALCSGSIYGLCIQSLYY